MPKVIQLLFLGRESTSEWCYDEKLTQMPYKFVHRTKYLTHHPAFISFYRTRALTAKSVY